MKETFIQKVIFLFKNLSLKKRLSFILSLLSFSLFLLFQNCQSGRNNFKALESLSPNGQLQLSLTALPKNSVNCNDGLNLTISTNSHFLAETPYSFDSGATWNILSFQTYTETTTFKAGQILVKDGNGLTVSNTAPFTLDIINCNMAQTIDTQNTSTSQNSPASPNIQNSNATVTSVCSAPAGSFCQTGTTVVSSCTVGFACAGGIHAPQSCSDTGLIPDANQINCVAPVPTGTWTASTSCVGTTETVISSCFGGNGQCSGPQPTSTPIPNSPTCGYVNATGIWAVTTTCNGTTATATYHCAGGNGICIGTQPNGSTTPNSVACGYIPQKWSYKVIYDRFKSLHCQGTPYTSVDFGYYGKWNDYGQDSYQQCETQRQQMLDTFCDIPDEYQGNVCQNLGICYSGNVKPVSACEVMP